MAKLSIMIKRMKNYLELHGDKNVTSISTLCGGSNNEYILHLHDIYNGPIGANPYTGEDQINIPKEENTDDGDFISKLMGMLRDAEKELDTCYDESSDYPCEYSKADLAEKEVDTLKKVLNHIYGMGDKVRNIKYGNNSGIGMNGYCPFCNKLIFKKDTDDSIFHRNCCPQCKNKVTWDE